MTSSARFFVVMTSTIGLCCAYDVTRHNSTTSSSSSSSSPYEYNHLNSFNQHPEQLLGHHRQHHQQQQLQLPRMTVSVVSKDESRRREGRGGGRGGLGGGGEGGGEGGRAGEGGRGRVGGGGEGGGEGGRGGVGGLGGGGGGGEGGSCEDIRAVQSTVIRILNDHHDYDRGLEAFQSELHSLRTDVNRLRKQMEKSFVPDAFGSKSSSSVVGKFPSSSSSSESNALPPSVGRTQDNLTFVVDLQGHQIRQLERRLRWLTKQHKRLQADSSSAAAAATVPHHHGRTIPPEEEVEEEGKKDGGGGGGERERERLLMLRCEREMAMTRDLTSKQRDINANVQRKMQQLEKMMADNIQSDDHNTHLHHHQSSNNQHRTHHHGVCPTGFLRHLSSCYLFENLTSSWIDAEKKCQSLNPNAHLVSIETHDEELFLLQFRSYNAVRWSSRYLWIGANDMTIEGRWTWVASGSEVIYANWRTGEPSNHRGEQHCAYLNDAPDDPPDDPGDRRRGRAGAAWNSVVDGGGGRTTGRWDDWNCFSARINFVCEIIVL